MKGICLKSVSQTQFQMVMHNVFISQNLCFWNHLKKGLAVQISCHCERSETNTRLSGRQNEADRCGVYARL